MLCSITHCSVFARGNAANMPSYWQPMYWMHSTLLGAGYDSKSVNVAGCHFRLALSMSAVPPSTEAAPPAPVLAPPLPPVPAVLLFSLEQAKSPHIAAASAAKGNPERRMRDLPPGAKEMGREATGPSCVTGAVAGRLPIFSY